MNQYCHTIPLDSQSILKCQCGKRGLENSTFFIHAARSRANASCLQSIDCPKRAAEPLSSSLTCSSWKACSIISSSPTMMEPNLVNALLHRHLESHGLPSDQLTWKIDKSPLGGRGMFATRDIDRGELIFVDAPLVVGPRCYNKYLPMCINCYKSGCPLFPCDRGCGLPVCSTLCENSTRHIAMECDYLRRLRPNCGSMWSMELLQAVVPIRALSLSDDQRNLVGAFEAHPRAVRELDLLKKNISEQVNRDDEIFMERVSRVFDTNAFETAAVVDNSVSISLRGLYPVGALQNHCCVPNTRHHFDKHQLLFTRAAFPIKKGDELTMTYTDLVWDTALRRQYLRMSKHFDCSCRRCSDPLEFGTLLGALRCANIDCFKNMFPNDPLNPETSWTCEDCGVRVSSRQIKGIRSGLSSIVNEILYKSPRQILSFVKGELAILVPETSSVMMDMKFRIISYFGRAEGLSWENLSNAELRTKAKYCRDLVSLLDNLGCGDCQKKGLILYEWYCTNVEIERRKSGKGDGNKAAQLPEAPQIEIREESCYDDDRIILRKAVEILRHDIAAPDDLSLIEIEP